MNEPPKVSAIEIPMTNSELLIKLIHEYISQAKKNCNALKSYYNLNDSILSAWRSNQIPKEGVLPDNTSYSLHGVGCYFENNNSQIDIDFGPNGRCDGFDLNRIKHYIQNKGFEFESLKYNESELEFYFSLLEAQGVIFNPRLAPSEHLYYLKEINDN